MGVQMSGGPDRIYDKDAAAEPMPIRHPLGFAPPAPRPVEHPQTWEGDNA